MYTLIDYGRMLDDRVRVDAYLEALRRAVRPGDTVLEIGTGLGFFAMYCCELGAAKVVAVEPDNVVAVAREIVSGSPYANQITLIQGLSKDVELPERADVIVSDLRGVLPLLTEHIPSIVDARARLLAAGGRLVPSRDDLLVGVVAAEEQYRLLAHPFEENARGYDMRVAREMALHSWTKVQLGEEALVGAPQRWATLDYATIESSSVSGRAELTAERGALAHGLLVWFDATLIEGVGFSNAPGAPPAVYQSAFFPWLEPVRLDAKDRVQVHLRADHVAGEYVWTWHTRIEHGDGRVTTFQQSTFFGLPMAREHLAKRASGRVVDVGTRGRVDAFILASLDGSKTNRAVAEAAMERHPGYFASLDAALARVGDLAVKYAR